MTLRCIAAMGMVWTLGCAGANRAVESPTQASGNGAASAGGNVVGTAELTAAVERIKACPYEDGFAGDCEGYAAWLDDNAMFENGKANAALVKMLASSDVKERFLAAEKLRTTMSDSTDVGSDVEGLLNAAEKEQDENVAKTLAETVSATDLAAAKKLDRAIAVAKAHPIPEYAEAFLFNAADSTKDRKLVSYAQEAQKSASGTMRNAALQAFARLASDYPAESCAGLDALRADKDAFVSGRATSEIARTRRCSAHYDKLLGALAGVDVRKDVQQDVALALDHVCDDKAASEPQRARAATIARKITDAPAAGVNARYYTLAAVLKCDPKGGPAYVAGFKAAKEATLAKRAADLLLEKKR